MGNFSSKTDPLEQLKKHFKLEMKGNRECYFEGARSCFDEDVHSKFQAWLMKNGYACVFSEDYIAGTFKYNIKRNLIKI